eukprot:4687815-Amphidinium_carterae.2
MVCSVCAISSRLRTLSYFSTATTRNVDTLRVRTDKDADNWTPSQPNTDRVQLDTVQPDQNKKLNSWICKLLKQPTLPRSWATTL